MSNFIINKSTKELIGSFCRNGSFPHTVLVEGGNPEVRLSFSRYFANMILCTGENKPCGVCSSCVKCKALSHPDLKEYGDIDTSSTFKVDTCREIRSDCFIIPNDGDKKVYILKEAQNMNDSGENSLLKIFEEPPSYVHFIVTCDSRSSMLETILSRATVISLGDSDSSAYNEETLQSAVTISKAAVGAAEIELLKALSPFEKDKDGFKKMLLCLADIYHETLKVKNGAKPSGQFDEISNLLASRLTADKLYELYNTANELYTGIMMNQNYNLLLTSTCYKLRRCVTG